ncbi:hypothetical protein HALLA_16675 [Halostagnicola larsenii XH-48]|uniref:Uncharacterized protein n=1 Tax=Halostagnicola larsenii XH-48 TaxID=797299 RepID=W0JR68_9EURY|nr:hypothetical protein [Halostagnicola larsenii]AHG01104.1 hypothetical protein HALLA_16675 [Halostagnicola larsenii XH-48]
MTTFDSVPDYLWQAVVLLIAILGYQIIARGEVTLSIAVIAIVGFVVVSWAVDSLRSE